MVLLRIKNPADAVHRNDAIGQTKALPRRPATGAASEYSKEESGSFMGTRGKIPRNTQAASTALSIQATQAHGK
jgi:hypothetical protein